MATTLAEARDTDVRIQLDADDFVTLKDVAEADLHPDDFLGVT